MVSNMHSCHSTETMPWLVILTDQSTSLLSPCALLKSSCSQWTLRHEKAVDVATMSISQSERRATRNPSSCKAKNAKFFALSATYPLIEVLLKINRSIWHPLLKKIVPKPRQRTLSAPSQRLGNSISRFDRRPTCPAATTGCYGPPLCIRPIGARCEAAKQNLTCVLWFWLVLMATVFARLVTASQRVCGQTNSTSWGEEEIIGRLREYTKRDEYESDRRHSWSTRDE